MDIENATCDFDNPEFISILKSAARAESYQYEAESNHAFKQIIKQLEDQDIIVATGVGEPEWIAFDRKFVSEDARFTYIGWPTPDGSCGSDLQLTFPIGVCADTDQAQGCWEFLKYMLQHPITAGDNAPLALYIPIFPEAMKVYNGQRNNYFPMIQADLDKALDLANQCEHMAFYDEAVLRIILEEAEWFLKGDATAEDTAAKIQARASLYLSEQYG